MTEIELVIHIPEEEYKIRSRKMGMSEWIYVKDKLPTVEQEVLIWARFKYHKDGFKDIITTGFYEDGDMSEEDSMWTWQDLDWVKWDEENDCAFVPEGWWEYRHYNPDDVCNNEIDDEVIAWMPIPEPYKAESEGEEPEI